MEDSFPADQAHSNQTRPDMFSVTRAIAPMRLGGSHSTSPPRKRQFIFQEDHQSQHAPKDVDSSKIASMDEEIFDRPVEINGIDVLSSRDESPASHPGPVEEQSMAESRDKIMHEPQSSSCTLPTEANKSDPHPFPTRQNCQESYEMEYVVAASSEGHMTSTCERGFESVHTSEDVSASHKLALHRSRHHHEERSECGGPLVPLASRSQPSGQPPTIPIPPQRQYVPQAQQISVSESRRSQGSTRNMDISSSRRNINKRGDRPNEYRPPFGLIRAVTLEAVMEDDEYDLFSNIPRDIQAFPEQEWLDPLMLRNNKATATVSTVEYYSVCPTREKAFGRN